MKLSFSQLDLAFLSEGAGSESNEEKELARKLCSLHLEGSTLKRLWAGRMGSAVIFKALCVRRLE